MAVTTASIDPSTEEIVPLADLGKLLGKNIQYNTVIQWCKEGRVNWNTRSRVQLECITMPSGLATSREAYFRFIERLNADD